MSKWKIAGIAIAAIAVALSLLNASWIAPAPNGRLILVAQGGIAQSYDETAAGADCTAARIRPTDHNFIENTVFSMQNAVRFGADAIELDVRPTRDGRMVVFRDAALECRTDGTGLVQDRTLAELKALDVGHGYTADGGRTFPLRGRGIGAMPAVEDVLQALQSMPLIFNIRSDDPNAADLLLASFARAGVKVEDRHGFHGAPPVLARLKALAPQAWTFSEEQVGACMADYVKLGWAGIVPESCRETTVAVPLDDQWTVWGWPNRFLARMADADSKVLMFERYEDGVIKGIDRPERLDDVPRSFRGHLWIEDFYKVGRALQR